MMSKTGNLRWLSHCTLNNACLRSTGTGIKLAVFSSFVAYIIRREDRPIYSIPDGIEKEDRYF